MCPLNVISTIEIFFRVIPPSMIMSPFQNIEGPAPKQITKNPNCPSQFFIIEAEKG
jgi:hypothetical protein